MHPKYSSFQVNRYINNLLEKHQEMIFDFSLFIFSEMECGLAH